MPYRPRRRAAGLLLWALCAATSSCGAREQGGSAAASSDGQKPETIEQLRREYAEGFLDPAPHMRLARHFRDSGNPVQAFYILEAARRGRFPEEEFDAAFKEHFLRPAPFDKSPEAEAALLAELARDPEAHDPHQKLADIYISREEYAKARHHLTKLVALSPEHYEDTHALAEVYRREGNEAEAEKTLAAWGQKYPETAQGYRIRAAQLEKQPEKSKALLAEAVAKYPEEVTLHFDLAGVLLREGRMKEAEPHYVRAAELAPGSYYVQMWVGRFFFKAVEDERRALDYYLRAYLLNPHAYETEFVESRIGGIVARQAEEQVRERLKGDASPLGLLGDPNPLVVQLAVEEMIKKWEPSYLERAVELMAHDDGGVRWAAMHAVLAKTDHTFDARLRELLADPDLRRRGLALYVAAGSWKRESHELLSKALGEEAQLLRFDAVSALLMSGDEEARRIALDHARREPHPRLKRLIESSSEREADTPE